MFPIDPYGIDTYEFYDRPLCYVGVEIYDVYDRPLCIGGYDVYDRPLYRPLP